MRKRERINNFMMLPIGGLLYHGNISRPYDSFGNKQELYAMDRWGNLMIVPNKFHKHAASEDEEDADYRHSSLNAGNAVICAGMITISGGKVTFMDNRSGHYRPTEKNLSVA